MADGETAAARVVLVLVNMDTAGDAEAVRAALVDRWGEPSAPEGVERCLVTDKWIDPACDVEAQLRLGPVAKSGVRAPGRVVVLRSLRAQARLEDRKNRERPGRGWRSPR